MRRPAVILTSLALIWGASFMLIKIADRQLAPSTLVLGRLGSATVLLAAIAFMIVCYRLTLYERPEAWTWN
jgi:drug/metabolite transporter (DMT)-like permease